jgi:capsular exopolysaccharide synthesis family protein
VPAFSDEEMLDRLRLRSYLHAVRRRWLSVLLVTVVVAGIGLALSLSQSPSYRAHSDVELEPTVSDLSKNAGLDSIDVATQVQLVTSLAVAELVQSDLQLSERPDLTKRVTVQPVGVSRIIRITATGSTAQGAADFANAVAKAFLTNRGTTAKQLYDAATGSLVQQQDDLTKSIADVEQRLAKHPRSTRLTTQRQNLLIQLGDISAQLNTLRTANPGTTGSGQLVSEAVPPAKPYSPRVVLNLFIATVIGLILGVGVALLRDRFDDVLYDPDAVRLNAGRWPVIAEIPAFGSGGGSSVLPADMDPHSPAGEAYAGLAVNVRYLLAKAMQGQRSAVVLVMSSRSQEGKSTLATNLAISVAKVGIRTTLVDADLRGGALASMFGLDSELPGLAEGVAGLSIEDAAVDVGIDNLKVLPAGVRPPNPNELLASSRMKATIKRMTRGNKLVVLDAPPAIVADGFELLDSVDLVVVVVRAGVSHRREMVSLLERLHQLGASSVAIVANDVHVDTPGTYYPA